MNNLISKSIIGLVFILLVFTRSFAGLYINNYRIGEYLVGAGLLTALFLFFIPNKFIKVPLAIHNNYRFLIFAFFITIYTTGTSLTATYTYRTSSYIWTAAYIFVGYYFLKNKINKNVFFLYLSGVFIVYIFGTGSYPDFLMNIFRNYGDKFTFVKASDMVLMIIITNIIALNSLEKKYSYYYFIFSVALFLPLIVQMSRGALATLILFSMFYLMFNFRFIFLNLKYFILLIVIGSTTFFISTFRVTQFDFSAIATENIEIVQIVDDEFGKISRTATNENMDTFMSLYFEQRYVPNQYSNRNNNVKVDTGWHNKLISTDGTFDWRLSMWQDQYYYQASEDNVLFGYGHTAKLPVFDLAYDKDNVFRIGHDKANEQIHNYLINIFARGGLLQLFTILSFHLIIYYIYYKKFKSHNILIFMVPPLFNAMTDISMEGVQFPINFYLIYGYLLSEGINLKNGIAEK